ncbi:hypothetical protein D3C78_1690630 [compost metagenome]
MKISWKAASCAYDNIRRKERLVNDADRACLRKAFIRFSRIESVNLLIPLRLQLGKLSFAIAAFVARIP